jgi:hypothetical protein
MGLNCVKFIRITNGLLPIEVGGPKRFRNQSAPSRAPRLGGSSAGLPLTTGHPVKVINDAVVQATGSYEGGRMLLFRLGHWPRFYSDRGRRPPACGVGAPPLPARSDLRRIRRQERFERFREKRWRHHVVKVIALLTARCALQVKMYR